MSGISHEEQNTPLSLGHNGNANYRFSQSGVVKRCFILGLVWGQLVLTSVSLMWVIKDDIFGMPIKFVRPEIILHEGLFDSFFYLWLCNLSV